MNGYLSVLCIKFRFLVEFYIYLDGSAKVKCRFVRVETPLLLGYIRAVPKRYSIWDIIQTLLV